MNVTFLQNEPLNTVIVNTQGGQPLYEVNTPWKLTGRTTTIRRVKPGVPAGQGQIVAQVQWHGFGSSTINFLGSAMDLDQFLRKEGIFSQSRTLTGSDGRVYQWKHASNQFTLVDCHTSGVVAQSHPSKSGFFSTPQKLNIDVYPQGMPNLDVLVVSFIVMEEKLRQRKRGSSAAVAAAA